MSVKLRWLVATAVMLGGHGAGAEPMPSGAIGLVTGAVSGTGPDAKRLGYGPMLDFGRFPFIGVQASWQPTTTERRLGWTVRWSTMFASLYNGKAAHIETALHTVQMDLTLGIRVRPWSTPSRYLTFRGGGELLRANEPIPSNDPSSSAAGNRAFFGAIASIGLDQYVAGFLFDIDVRYGIIASGGPSELALLIGFGFAGP